MEIVVDIREITYPLMRHKTKTCVYFLQLAISQHFCSQIPINMVSHNLKAGCCLLASWKNTNSYRRKSLFPILFGCFFPIPRTQRTSIFEGQPSKTRPFPIKTRVIWVLGILYWKQGKMFILTFVWGGERPP